MRGKLAGLLELGAGFQQDLTGRENIYLNGSLLGMSKREIDRVFDAIVDFSELEEFIDSPVKFYSSGMYVRLGFAVAVNVDPDILVVDEVLAVGDERFQRKCIDRVKQFQQEGRTILLVTHCRRHRAQHLRPRRGAQPRPAGGRGGARRGHPHLPGAPHGRGCGHVDRRPGARGGAGVARRASRAGALPDAERPVRFRSVHRVFSGDNTVPYMRTGDDLTVRVEFEALLPDGGRGVLARDPRRATATRSCAPTPPSSVCRSTPPGHGRHALRHRGHADARRVLLLRRRDPEPGRHPLRLAGEAGTFEVMNPGKTTGIGAHGRARGAHLDRERPGTAAAWRSPAEQDSQP